MPRLQPVRLLEATTTACATAHGATGAMPRPSFTREVARNSVAATCCADPVCGFDARSEVIEAMAAAISQGRASVHVSRDLMAIPATTAVMAHAESGSYQIEVFLSLVEEAVR